VQGNVINVGTYGLGDVESVANGFGHLSKSFLLIGNVMFGT